jgi:hypothetical protein
MRMRMRAKKGEYAVEAGLSRPCGGPGQRHAVADGVRSLEEGVVTMMMMVVVVVMVEKESRENFGRGERATVHENSAQA